jgi:hypothetical protein
METIDGVYSGHDIVELLLDSIVRMDKIKDMNSIQKKYNVLMDMRVFLESNSFNRYEPLLSILIDTFVYYSKHDKLILYYLKRINKRSYISKLFCIN